MSLADFLHWVRTHKSSVAGLVFVVVGCWALTHLSRRVHHLQPRPASAASAVSVDDAASTGGGDGGTLAPAGVRGTEHGERSARMRGEFENAGSAIEFIQRAIARPQEGGKFYAMLAWKRCDEVARHPGGSPVHVGDDGVYEAAAAMVENVGRRCAAVLDAYPTLQTLYGVAVDQRGGKDLLLPADGRGIVSPTSRATASADIDAALRTGDRWAEAEALRSNARHVDVGNTTGDDAADRQLHELGAEVVGCELVGDCRGGLQSALHCTTTGDCTHDDWRDVVRSQVPEAQQAAFDGVVAGLRERMRLAPGRPGSPG